MRTWAGGAAQLSTRKKVDTAERDARDIEMCSDKENMNTRSESAKMNKLVLMSFFCIGVNFCAFKYLLVSPK